MIPFLLEHWISAATALTAALGWAMLEVYLSREKRDEVSPQKAVTLMNREGALVLDLREPDEFAREHILQAKHAPFASLEEKIKDWRKWKNRPCILLGPRAKKAKAVFVKSGFSKVFVLQQAMAGWKKAGLPVVKEEEKGT